jgi:hypothetical protein
MFTIFTQLNNKPLGKEFTVDGKGVQRPLYAGSTFIVEERPIVEVLPTLTNRQAIGLGVPNKRKGMIDTTKHPIEGAITRSNKYFSIPKKALLVVDNDIKQPKEVIVGFLREVGFQSDIVIAPGSSNGIKLADGTPHPDSNPHSYHFIIELSGVPSTSDYKRLVKQLHKLAIVKGLARATVTEGGTILIRSIVDESVCQPSGLLYVRPTLRGELYQEFSVEVDKGRTPTQPFFIPPVDDSDVTLRRNELMTDESLLQLQAEIKERIALKRLKDLDTISDKSGALDIEEIVKASQDNIVYVEPHTTVELQEEGGGRKTTKLLDIVLEPHKYHERYCSDPRFSYDPETNNETKARIFNDENSLLGLYSFKLGQSQLRVKLHLSTALSLSHDTREGKVPDERLLEMCVLSDFNPEDLREIVATLKKYRGTTKSILDQYVTRARKKRLKHIKNKAEEYSEVYDHRKDTVMHLLPVYVLRGVLQEKVFASSAENLYAILRAYGLDFYEETQSGRVHVEGLGIAFDDEDAQNRVLNKLADLMNKNDIKVKPSDVAAQLGVLAVDYQMKRNIIHDFILEEKWDGRDRLKELLDSVKVYEYTESTRSCFERAMTYCLVGGVAAVDGLANCPRTDADPKYELTPILSGAQGVRKSTFIKTLVPKRLREYYASVSEFYPGDKDHLMLVGDKWVVEFGEIDSTLRNKTKISVLKEFLSRESIEYRAPYAVKPVRRRRRFIAIGTVNGTNFLKDRTGNRRWPSFEVVSIEKLSWGDDDIQQLWAQLWELYIKGQRWWFTPEEEAEQEEENKFFIADDALALRIEEYLKDLDDDEEFNASTIAEALYPFETIEQSKLTSIGMALNNMGYRKHKKNNKTYYIKGDRDV